MKRCVTRWLGVGCLSLITGALCSPDVLAGHGSWGSSGGWYGGSSGGGSSGGWYGGSSGGGSYGGWYGSHGSSGGWYGGSSGGGSSGGWHGGSSGGGSYGGWHGGSGGSSGGYHGGGGYHHNGGGHYGGGGGYVSRGYGVQAPAYASTRSSRYYGNNDSRVARVVVRVPADAKVYLQDQPMSLSGRVRRFVSPTLQTGAEYTYTVRVEVERDGKTLSKETDARVRAGDRVEVSVSFDDQNPEQLVSSVQPVSIR